MKQAGYRFHGENRITIAGREYKYFAHRPFNGTIKTVTIKRTGAGVTLCADCHALAHGTPLRGEEITAEEVQQACVEYLADLYTTDEYVWNPWQKRGD